MKKILALLALGAIAVLPSVAQEARKITLPMLYDAIERSNPISGVKPKLDSIKDLQIKGISTTLYPKLDINAMATWQSEVLEINLPMPGVSIPTPDHDQYRVTLDLAQVIWDGGSTAARRELAIAQAEADKSSIQNELYGLRDKVNEAFFSIATIDITQKQLELMRDELSDRLVSLESAVRHGVLLQSSIASLKAEIIRLEQKLLELPLRKSSTVALLESLTQIEISTTDEFLLPQLEEDKRYVQNRPELVSFSSQKSALEARSNLVLKKRMPIVSAFVTSGYGKPSLNMLSNEWNPYVMVGARLSWNIWDWNVTKQEREQLSIQKKSIDLRKRAFEQGVESAVISSDNQIEILTKQLQKDDEIIELLEEVKRKSESQLASGVISSTEYLTDFNAAARARLDMEYRKVLLTKERVKRHYLLGMEL